MTRQQTNTMQAVLDCRTARYGMMALDCSACDLHSTHYHSCGNRTCPTCQHHDTTLRLNRQQQKLLPVNYFMVTFTLPAELRSLCWHYQKTAYNIMLAAVKSTLSNFARNDKRLGADIGMTMVLHLLPAGPTQGVLTITLMFMSLCRVFVLTNDGINVRS